MTKSEKNEGYISAINGSLIEVKGIEDEVRLHDLIRLKRFNIIGEVIQIYSDYVVAQFFEDTNNLKLYEEIINEKEPLSMELGPGLLSNVFDGIQRPLETVYENFDKNGFLERGIDAPSLSRTTKWHFVPIKKQGESVNEGDIIGYVQETPLIEHKIMIPPEISGEIVSMVEEGDYTIAENICTLSKDGEVKEIQMMQKWSVIENRPYKMKKRPDIPLITGLRVIDLLFPVAKGGTVAVPGGFGTGKTIIQQSLAKWCDADVIVFVGCGERGNEIADVLREFSKIIDPKSGRPLIERIVLIANTSNMPVSAREASIFSGVTIAEYYRDMGYDVALLADSTSRWAESLREISGLLEEMPAEEGYPAYLPSKLSGFYERAGTVSLLGENENGHREGSVSIIGSVSPPSGDFNEPVTATTKRFVQAFWALDASLAYSKHYPAINWLDSYSNYPEYVSEWWDEKSIDWKEIDMGWFECRNLVNEILSIENNLKNITQLIGEENLPEDQQLILFIANIIKNGFLIQNAFDKIDAYTSPKKLLGQIKIILLLYLEGKKLLKEGIIIEDLKELEIIEKIMRISQSVENDDINSLTSIKNEILRALDNLRSMYGGIGI